MLNKETILTDLPAVSQAQCYNRQDVEVLFQCGKDAVDNWIKAGLLKGIKTGNKLVFPQFELIRFQHEMLGKDISNILQVEKVRKSLIE